MMLGEVSGADAPPTDICKRHGRTPSALKRVRAAAWAVALAALALCGGGGVAAPQATAGGGVIPLSNPTRIGRLAVTLNKSETMHFGKPFAEALVANPDFADVTPLTDRALYIIGKRVGQTRITVLDVDKRLLGVIDIEIGFDVPALRRALQADPFLGGVKVSDTNGRILLSGTVPDAPSQQRALTIAEQFAPQGVNNSMSVRASQQVLLEVRFVEINRTAARDLGINWANINSNIAAATGSAGAAAGATSPATIAAGNVAGAVAGTIFGSGVFGLAGIPSGSTPFGQAVINVLSKNGNHTELVIQALEKRGLARRLAEPNLVTLSGDTANFLAGGEFPYPSIGASAAGSALVTVEFKKFGIGLAFTPTVLGEGQINLKIEPEVSAIDPTQSFNYGNGISIPGLVVRRASTTVELRDGQSFAIAGLLDNKHTADTTALPWIGQVPVLGALFKSSSYLKSETDLVIIVTPHLVKPAIPGEKLATPLDDKVAGNDIDFFLLGRSERTKHVEGAYGHILDVAGPSLAARASVEHRYSERDTNGPFK